jgi:hypothetical protein
MVKPRTAVGKPGFAVLQEARDPFVDSFLQPPRAVAMAFGGLVQYLPHQFGLAARCQTGIPVDVRSIPRESLKLRNLSFPDPDRMGNLLKIHS